MKQIEMIIDLIYCRLLGTVIRVIAGVMVLSVLLQIMGRYLLTTPFPWTEELSRLMFVWLALLGACLTLVENGHLGMDFIFRKCSPRVKGHLELFAWIVIGICAALMLYSGCSIVRIVAKQKSAILRLSYAWSYSAVPAAGGLFLLYSILAVIRVLCFGWSREREKEG